MSRFIAGVGAGIVTTVLAIVLGLALLGSRTDAPPPPPRAVPSTTPSPAPGSGETVLGVTTMTSAVVATSDGELRDVRASGDGVRFGKDGIRANRLEISAMLPFATAARQVGEGIELFDAGSGRAGIRRVVTVLGLDLPVSATGVVRADDGQLVIEPETIELGGPAWLDSGVSAGARSLVTIRHTVGGLPQGMRLVEVSVAADGFRTRLEGADVHIRTQELASQSK